MSRPRFASQVDEKNDLSKTVTPHYLPKVRESAAAKPHQDARKMTQDKTRIPNHRDMASTRAHCTPNACTPKPRNIYRSSLVSKCSGGMSNGVPLVNSCAKVQSLYIRNNNPVELKNHTHKPGRQIGIGQRWIPTGKMFTDSTTKVDSEPPNGSNDDTTNPYECQSLFSLVQEFKEFKSDEHASKRCFGQNNSGLSFLILMTVDKTVQTRFNVIWALLQSLHALFFKSKESDSNVEYLRANLNIKGMSNSRRTSLSNVDYMLYPSLLRTVTDWKGKPSLRSTEVAEESYLPHFS
ncbi:hypothetical protein Tco_1088110 [Tanacetum coccineum]